MSSVYAAKAGEALSRSDILARNMARNHFLSQLNDNSGNFALYIKSNMNGGGEAKPMMSRLISAFVAAVCLVGLVAPAFADQEDSGYSLQRKKGGYSYDKSESVNAYGQSQRKNKAPPGPPDFRDQTPSGPFDNSFFFDSGVGSLYGGNSPYMH